MKKPFTDRIIREQLLENPSDVLNYIKRLENLFEKTSNEYLFLKNKAKKTKYEDLELKLLEQESITVYENIKYLKRIYNEYLKDN